MKHHRYGNGALVWVCLNSLHHPGTQTISYTAFNSGHLSKCHANWFVPKSTRSSVAHDNLADLPLCAAAHTHHPRVGSSRSTPFPVGHVHEDTTRTMIWTPPCCHPTPCPPRLRHPPYPSNNTLVVVLIRRPRAHACDEDALLAPSASNSPLDQATSWTPIGLRMARVHVTTLNEPREQPAHDLVVHHDKGSDMQQHDQHNHDLIPTIRQQSSPRSSSGLLAPPRTGPLVLPHSCAGKPKVARGYGHPDHQPLTTMARTCHLAGRWSPSHRNHRRSRSPSSRPHAGRPNPSSPRIPGNVGHVSYHS